MNQHIRTIAILGAGAVGSYLVMGLSDKYKENLWVIARSGNEKTVSPKMA